MLKNPTGIQYYKHARDVFTSGEKCTFLVGAGISLQPPTCIPSARELVKNLVGTFIPPRAASAILNLQNLRYEILAESIQENADANLDFLNYFDTFETPNIIHQFLASAIMEGHHVITTNFDYMIERALMQAVPTDQHARIKPVITRGDFERCSDPLALSNDGNLFLYKIHGSKRNIITGEDTTGSVITTIAALGKNKEKGVTFALEPFKLPVYKSLAKGRTIIVLGYSGRDDFDIGPALRSDLGIKRLIWIDHMQDDGAEEIFSFDKDTHPSSKAIGVDDLLELVWIESNSEVIKIRASTAKLLQDTLWPMLLTKSTVPAQSSTPAKLPTNFKAWFDGRGRAVDSAKKFQIAAELLMIFGEYDLLWSITADSVQSTNQEEKAYALDIQGNDALGKGNHEKAIEIYQAALQILEELHLEKGVGLMLSRLGRANELRGDLALASELESRALEISRKIGDKEIEATVLHLMSMLAQHKGDLDEAICLSERSIAVDEESGELRSKALHMLQAGLLTKARKDMEKALATFQAAAKIAEQLGDDQLFCRIGLEVAELLFAKDSPHAWEWTKKLKAIGERLQLYSAMVQIHAMEALDYQKFDRWPLQAKNSFLEMIKWAERAKNHGNILFGYVNVGHIYWKSQVYDKAKHYYELAKAIAVEHGMAREIAIIQNFIENSPPKSTQPGGT